MVEEGPVGVDPDVVLIRPRGSHLVPVQLGVEGCLIEGDDGGWSPFREGAGTDQPPPPPPRRRRRRRPVLPAPRPRPPVGGIGLHGEEGAEGGIGPGPHGPPAPTPAPSPGSGPVPSAATSVSLLPPSPPGRTPDRRQQERVQPGREPVRGRIQVRRSPHPSHPSSSSSSSSGPGLPGHLGRVQVPEPGQVALLHVGQGRLGGGEGAARRKWRLRGRLRLRLRWQRHPSFCPWGSGSDRPGRPFVRARGGGEREEMGEVGRYFGCLASGGELARVVLPPFPPFPPPLSPLFPSLPLLPIHHPGWRRKGPLWRRGAAASRPGLYLGSPPYNTYSIIARRPVDGGGKEKMDASSWLVACILSRYY